MPWQCRSNETESCSSSQTCQKYEPEIVRYPEAISGQFVSSCDLDLYLVASRSRMKQAVLKTVCSGNPNGESITNTDHIYVSAA